ncbi:ribonuclease III [Tessaracoccus antarcticus]|uniref:ribonuclease III n=1 Tax=Tessaracoccus antarcticus TaxID=2479848 RepID=UPI001F326091|nr:ribonuclease III [Tessaracoccus antarcticus]
MQKLDELGVHVDAQLFELAFTHRSWAYENGRIESNERLEFLGDAVLQIVVTEFIFRRYPTLAEGQMAKLRASVVSSHALSQVARDLGLGEHVKLGKGEVSTGGDRKTSILADTMEALIGAIHMSGGSEASDAFVHGVFDPLITRSEEEGSYTDFKTALQELCAHHGWGAPVYEITGTGPDHQRVFTAVAVVDGKSVATGTAPSKKTAEQRAATLAHRVLTGSPDA